MAFSDANALWEPDALRVLVAAFAQRRVATRVATVRARRSGRGSATPAARCASCRTASGAGATNQEGLYWRYEMAVRCA